MKTVLIAGAGIAGLATALELGLQGFEVTVLERGYAMQEASWAAAGMLAAHDPENPAALGAFARWSLSLYPRFLRQIGELSGLGVRLRTAHTLQLCEESGMARSGVYSSGEALTGEVLTAQEAGRRVPGFRPAPGCNLIWLEEQSLDPRDLCRALPTAVRAAGVRLMEKCPVASIELEDGGVTAKTPAGEFHADALVMCSGAWSELCQVPLCIPRKGQMVAVRMPRGNGVPQLETVLRSREIYLVPRSASSPSQSKPDGSDASRILLGATVEDAGFDRAIRADATAWLLARAAELWPPIRDAEVEEVWTGIRPATIDGLPLIGPMEDAGERSASDARLWLATGHYRNGILLAPGTAAAIASWLRGVAPDALPIDMGAFRPSRFDLAFPSLRKERDGLLL